MTYPVAYWCRLWQAQIEHSAAMMAWWAQFVPHETAAQLSAEAEAAHQPPKLVKSRRKVA